MTIEERRERRAAYMKAYYDRPGNRAKHNARRRVARRKAKIEAWQAKHGKARMTADEALKTAKLLGK